MLRSPCELLTRPRLKLSPMLGEFKMGVFVTLKNSARNSSLLDSLNGNSFWTLRSPERRPGPRTVPTPQVPNVPGTAGPYEAGSNHWKPMNCPVELSKAGFRPNTRGGATQLARGPRELVPEASSATIVSGNPPWNWTILPTCQLPITALTSGFKFLPHLLLRPTGSS